jgi:iron complex transport system permease protein
VVVVSSVVALVVSFVAAVAIGPVFVSIDTVVAVIGHHLSGERGEVTWSPVEEQIVWDLRMPRAILAVVVGAGLALVGAVLQALVRNPLADPYLLGVSSGASLGAVVVLVLGSSAAAGLSLPAAAVTGAILATVLVYGLAQHRKHSGRRGCPGVAGEGVS